MFNFSGRQIMVIQPIDAGGGIVSFLLSLSPYVASLNFKNINLDQKLQAWDSFLLRKTYHAHLYGFINFDSPQHVKNLQNADYCNTYIHKAHFSELQEQNLPMSSTLDKFDGETKSIGMFLTDACIESLALQGRHIPDTWYERWIYYEQKTLLKTFYNIDCLHTFPFIDLMNIDTFIDHLKYISYELNLDLDMDLSRKIISQWYKKTLRT